MNLLDVSKLDLPLESLLGFKSPEIDFQERKVRYSFGHFKFPTPEFVSVYPEFASLEPTYYYAQEVEVSGKEGKEKVFLFPPGDDFLALSRISKGNLQIVFNKEYVFNSKTGTFIFSEDQTEAGMDQNRRQMLWWIEQGMYVKGFERKVDLKQPCFLPYAMFMVPESFHHASDRAKTRFVLEQMVSPHYLGITTEHEEESYYKGCSTTRMMSDKQKVELIERFSILCNQLYQQDGLTSSLLQQLREYAAVHTTEK